MSKRGSSSARKEKSKDKKKRDRSPRRRRDRDRSPRRGREDRDRSPKRRGNVRDLLGPPQPELQPRYPPQQFTPLTALVSQAYTKYNMRSSYQIKTDPTKRDMTKYCDFHRDHGHRTDDCIQLKKEIKFLIRRGHLRCYVAPEDRNRAPPPPPRQPALAQHQQPLGEINVISGGFARGVESSSARKAHLRSFKSGETLEVQAVSKFPRLDTTITFSDADLKGCQHPHDDPLLIRVIVANKTVHRVLIGNRSSADIIFASTFDKMGIEREKLEPVNTHLRGFSGERVLPLGSVQLVLTLGDPPCQARPQRRQNSSSWRPHRRTTCYWVGLPSMS